MIKVKEFFDFIMVWHEIEQLKQQNRDLIALCERSLNVVNTASLHLSWYDFSDLQEDLEQALALVGK